MNNPGNASNRPYRSPATLAYNTAKMPKKIADIKPTTINSTEDLDEEELFKREFSKFPPNQYNLFYYFHAHLLLNTVNILPFLLLILAGLSAKNPAE